MLGRRWSRVFRENSKQCEIAAALAAYSFLNGCATFFGGLAHQFFPPTRLNDVEFRMLWTACVSSVGLSGAALGVLASRIRRHGGGVGRIQRDAMLEVTQAGVGEMLTEMRGSEGGRVDSKKKATQLAADDAGGTGKSVQDDGGNHDVLRSRRDTPRSKSTSSSSNRAPDGGSLKVVPQIPEYFWGIYGFIAVACVVSGYYSCSRPAADIFLCGVLVAPATIYLLVLLVLFQTRSSDHRGSPNRGMQRLLRAFFVFILPCPSLTWYPTLVSWGWELGTINACLHLMLFIAWCGQWWVVDDYCLNYI